MKHSNVLVKSVLMAIGESTGFTYMRCGSVSSLVLCEVCDNIRLVRAAIVVADVLPRPGLICMDAILVSFHSLI